MKMVRTLNGEYINIENASNLQVMGFPKSREDNKQIYQIRAFYPFVYDNDIYMEQLLVGIETESEAQKILDKIILHTLDYPHRICIIFNLLGDN